MLDTHWPADIARKRRLKLVLGVGGCFWTLGAWAFCRTPVLGVDDRCRRGARMCATAASVARPSMALVEAPYTKRRAP